MIGEKGLGVFPLKPNTKRPIINSLLGLGLSDDPDIDKGGFANATIDLEQIKKWWTEFPDANIGVCPGENHIVVDLDRKHGKDGVESICKSLGIDQFEILSDTFIVQTTTGGYHLYYKCEEGWGSPVSVLAGVDIRGMNGYVLGPGSTLDGTAYEVYYDGDTVPIREDLKPFLRKPSDTQSEEREPVAGVEDQEGQIGQGLHHLVRMIELSKDPERCASEEIERNECISVSGEGGNQALYNLACHLKGFGISQQKTFDLLTMPGGWNDHCEPPWDTDELITTIGHAYRYGKEQPGVRGGGTMEAFEAAAINGHADIHPVMHDVNVVLQPEINDFDRLKAITFDGKGITSRKIQKEMIIPEWFPAHGFTAILAERGVGKSVIMLDIAMRVACKLDWHGFPVSKKGWKILYMCGEDDIGFTQQYKAWVKKYEVEPKSEDFHIMTGVPNLVSKEDVNLWAAYIKHLYPNERVIVFVDTWQRATTTVSQNDDDRMQVAVKHLEMLAKELNGPAMAAFHPPKANKGTILGSSTIENATVAILKMEESTTSRKLWVDRMKGKGEGNYQLFKFESVDLNELDEFGRMNTGVYPEKIGGVENEESLEVIKGAFAFVVKELDLDRKNNFPDSKLFSISKAAKAISELKDHEDQGWAEKLFSRLREARITTYDKDKILNHLNELFVNDPRPHDFGDGNVLELFKKGAYKFFRVRRDGMTDHDPTNDEDENETGSEVE
jgi:hypothetical protein